MGVHAKRGRYFLGPGALKVGVSLFAFLCASLACREEARCYPVSYNHDVESASFEFFWQGNTLLGFVVLTNKKGEQTAIREKYGTLVYTYLCKEVDFAMQRPDKRAYTEEKNILVKPGKFQEVTTPDGRTFYGLPVLVYEQYADPEFKGAREYEVDREFRDRVYDHRKVCDTVTVQFKCWDIDIEKSVRLRKGED